MGSSSLARMALAGVAAVATPGCGPSARSLMPDYSTWLRAGVDHAAEAEAIAAGLEGAGFVETQRLEGTGWIALEMRRGTEERAIRVVTSRGAALVLDSHDPSGVLPRHGHVSLVAPDDEPEPSGAASGHDLDGDGADEILVAAEDDGRRCVLPFRIDPEGAIAPVAPDTRAWGSEVCVERFADIDGNRTREAIVALRFAELARDAVPIVEAAILLDEHHRYVARIGPATWIEVARAARRAEARAAIAAHEPEVVYRVAIELAALSFLGGESSERRLAAFDEAFSGAVVSEALIADIRRAREAIASWETTWRPAAETEEEEE